MQNVECKIQIRDRDGNDIWEYGIILIKFLLIYTGRNRQVDIFNIVL